MNYDDLQPGTPVTVTTRHNMPAAVVSKFKSTSPGPSAPIGTEYACLKNTENGKEFFNYPHQLEPR